MATLEAVHSPTTTTTVDPSTALPAIDRTDALAGLEELMRRTEEERGTERLEGVTQDELADEDAQTDALFASLTTVEHASLLALNTLLYASLSSILPLTTSWQHPSPTSTSDALPLVLSNVRTAASLSSSLSSSSASSHPQMSERPVSSCAEGELHRAVEEVAYLLSPPDAKLALALASLVHALDLLAHSNLRLASTAAASPASPDDPFADPTGETDVYSTLQRQLADLQIRRQESHARLSLPPRAHTSEEHLWQRVDVLLNTVSLLCSERAVQTPHPREDDEVSLPPSYVDEDEQVPTYHLPASSSAAAAEKEKAPGGGGERTSTSDETMRRDLESVTAAIDRLIRAAPQLADQRVELSRRQVRDMDLARLEGTIERLSARRLDDQRATASPAPTLRAKGKERAEVHENEMFERIEKAAGRRMEDQRVEMGSRMRDAQRAAGKKKDAELSDILARNHAGRLTSQEAVLNDPRIQNSLLTLGEFMSEPLPKSFARRGSEPSPSAAAAAAASSSPLRGGAPRERGRRDRALTVSR